VLGLRHPIGAEGPPFQRCAPAFAANSPAGEGQGGAVSRKSFIVASLITADRIICIAPHWEGCMDADVKADGATAASTVGRDHGRHSQRVHGDL